MVLSVRNVLLKSLRPLRNNRSLLVSNEFAKVLSTERGASVIFLESQSLSLGHLSKVIFMLLMGIMDIIPDSNMTVPTSGFMCHSHLERLVGRRSGWSGGENNDSASILHLRCQNVVQDVLKILDKSYFVKTDKI